MKFGISKLPKTFYKNTEKKFKLKQQNKQESSSIEDRKVNTNFCYDRRKSFVTGQIQCCHCGGPGGLASPFWSTKNTCFGASHNKKTGNGVKRNNNIQSYVLH